VFNFYHRQITDCVRAHSLDTEAKRRQRHERLADHFQSQDLFPEPQTDLWGEWDRLSSDDSTVPLPTLPYPTYTVQPATPTPVVVVITATGPAATNTPTPIPFKFVSAFIKPTKGTCNYYVTGWGFTPKIEVTLVTESAAATLKTKVKTDDKGFFSIMLVKNFNLGGFVGQLITTTAYDSKGNYLADAVETVPDACPKN